MDLADTDRGWRDAVRTGTIFWIISQALGHLGAIIGSYDAGPRFRGHNWEIVTCFWDCGFYSRIVKQGYAAGYPPGSPYITGDGASPTTGELAFLPGYPLLSRAVAMLVGGQHFDGTAALVGLQAAAMLGALGAAIAWCRYLSLTWPDRPSAQFWGAVLYLLGPYAFFFSASYAEPLYLGFAIGAWVACLRRHYLVAGLLGALASFTRISGAFLAVALCVLCLQQLRADGRTWFGRNSVVGRELFATALASVGAFLALGYIGYLWGSPTGYLKVQGVYWQRGFEWPWVAVSNQVTKIFSGPLSDSHIQQRWVELLFAIVLYACLIVFIKRRQWAEVTLLALVLYFMTFNKDFTSLGRNSLSVFPAYALIASWVARAPRIVRVLILIVTLGWMVFNAVQFGRAEWAG